MSKDFVFFSDDNNKWNYNKLIGSDVDPFNVNKKSNENENYNVKKWNCLIFLKEILKKSNFNIDLLNWINKKCFFGGGKCDYWEILNITTWTFYYNLFKTNDDIITYKDFRKWCLKNPLYIKTDKTIEDFEGDNEYLKELELRDYIKNMTCDKLFKKVMEIEDDEETKKRYLIICMFLKNKVICSSGLGKLCQNRFY